MTKVPRILGVDQYVARIRWGKGEPAFTSYRAAVFAGAKTGEGSVFISDKRDAGVLVGVRFIAGSWEEWGRHSLEGLHQSRGRPAAHSTDDNALDLVDFDICQGPFERGMAPGSLSWTPSCIVIRFYMI